MRKLIFTISTITLCILSFMLINTISSNFFNVDMLFFTEHINLSNIEIIALVSLWGGAGGIINSLTSKWQIKKIYSLEKISRPNSILNQRLIEINKKIANKLKIKPASLYSYKSEEKNAFVCGFFKNRAMLVVSSNLLYSLSENELEAVLWHEYAHIINGVF